MLEHRPVLKQHIRAHRGTGLVQPQKQVRCVVAVAARPGRATNAPVAHVVVGAHGAAVAHAADGTLATDVAAHAGVDGHGGTRAREKPPAPRAERAPARWPACAVRDAKAARSRSGRASSGRLPARGHPKGAGGARAKGARARRTEAPAKAKGQGRTPSKAARSRRPRR